MRPLTGNFSRFSQHKNLLDRSYLNLDLEGVSNFCCSSKIISFPIIPIFLLKQIYEFPSRDPQVATAVSFTVMNEFRGRCIILSQAMRNWRQCWRYNVLHQIPFHSRSWAVVKTSSKNFGGYHQGVQGIPQVLYFGGSHVLRLCCAWSLFNFTSDVFHSAFPLEKQSYFFLETVLNCGCVGVKSPKLFSEKTMSCFSHFFLTK